jgi:hypothetical protein
MNMHIMTKQGWRPLVSFAGMWAARHARLRAAYARLEATKQMQVANDQDRAAKNNALNRAYGDVFRARDAMLGDAAAEKALVTA